MPGTSPTVRQRELAARLRQLRHDRGLTVDDVAKELLCSSTKISRIETAARRPSLRDVRDLCRVYGIADHTWPPADRRLRTCHIEGHPAEDRS